MKLEMKVGEIHNENLRWVSDLSFISDQIKVFGKLLQERSKEKSSAAIAEINEDFSKLQKKILVLKKKILRVDSQVCKLLTKGHLIPDEELDKVKPDKSDLREVRRKFSSLKLSVARILR